jgi:hypothetical protein
MAAEASDPQAAMQYQNRIDELFKEARIRGVF